MNDNPKQTCKHCGTEVTGQPVAGGSFGPGGAIQKPYPLAYRFTCNGQGPHGDDNSGREWFWTIPDPADIERNSL